MKPAALLGALPVLLATPAVAQHRHHAGDHPAPAAQPAQPEQQEQPAQPSGHADHETMGAMQPPPPPTAAAEAGGQDQAPGPEAAEEPVGNEPAPAPPADHAADRVYDPAEMAAARAQLRREHGAVITSKVMWNLGEYQVRSGENGYRWDGEAWWGGDLNRLVVKSEGEGGASSGVAGAEIQGLYSRAITPYFDLQLGVRHDFRPNPSRTYAALGFEGVAPYWFETNGAIFLSDHGEVLGRIEGTYDFRLTQRWILQPRTEINLSAKSTPETGTGSGVSNVELGLRLRYEIRREFAPYVGVSFDRKLGGTADFARARGEEPSQTSFVVGLRAWF